MGLEEVKKEILEKAKSEADRIINEGKKEAEKIMDETSRKIKEYRENVNNDTKKLLDIMERKEIAGAEFDVKKMKLDKKKEMIDRAFSNVVGRLRRIPEKKRETLIRKLIEKAKKEIDVKYVYASKDDRKIIEKIPSVKYREADISGGIIAENEDGSISIDYSYEEILDGIKKENLQEIASKLFGK